MPARFGTRKCFSLAFGWKSPRGRADCQIHPARVSGWRKLSLRDPLPAQRDPKGWLVAPALVFILALSIYPFAYGLMLSFNPMNGGGIWANYVTFFTDSSMWPTIIVTLKLAVPATIINGGVSVPVAFALRRKLAPRSLVSAIV